MSKTHVRIDNHLLFLIPKGALENPTHLQIVGPKNWKVATGWGFGSTFNIQNVSKLVEGMIVLGDYAFSKEKVNGFNVIFAIKGKYPHQFIKKQFLRVLDSQQRIGRSVKKTFNSLKVHHRTDSIATPNKLNKGEVICLSQRSTFPRRRFDSGHPCKDNHHSSDFIQGCLVYIP